MAMPRKRSPAASEVRTAELVVAATGVVEIRALVQTAGPGIVLVIWWL